jgi:tRNA-specific 2-thiouridylase
MSNGTRVMVAMSGGVDSSVAACLLRKCGYEVVGATMCLGVGGATGFRSCCDPKAIDDAKHVCSHLEIPHFVFDFSVPFRKHVIDDFVLCYSRGTTPNPCVRCNAELKFDLLLCKAKAMGFSHIATGHYAKIESGAGGWFLKRPLDTVKDQTYFLYGIPRSSLESVLFPLCDLTKPQVREIARDEGIAVAEKAESQDICFVSDNNYRSYIDRAVPQKSGPIVDTCGKVLGRHEGIGNYTIGQRRKLGIAAGTPLYVVAVEAQRNTVVVGLEKDLFSKSLSASRLNMLVDEIPADTVAKIRYAHSPVACRTVVLGNGTMAVEFAEPQRAVTPGQSVVVYSGDTVVGGGIIDGAF